MASYDQTIMSRLSRIEEEEDVHILYACESGSRAWGFESGDSDFDVRFIYLHRPAWYLTVQRGRDVIERPIDDMLDISGWDLPKALGLLRKSNPPLLEWLQSPIVYQRQGSLLDRLHQLLPLYYSPVSCVCHYLHMARGNQRQYLQGNTVWLKKYFYVLRPLFACLWIERGFGTPPTEFGVLVERIVDEPDLQEAIDALLACKRAGQELDEGPRIPAISDFVDCHLARLSSEALAPAETQDNAALDELFLDLLVETYGNHLRP